MPTGPRLNLTQVTTLRELVRHGTLAAAAQHLGYTPGAVSQHLASLEASLGVRLVERSGRHLVLTDAGRVMAGHAEELLAAETRAVSATRSAVDAVAGPLVVGTWGSTAAALLAPLVQRMAAAAPEVVIRSREVDLDAASSEVRNGEVDVAFGLDYLDAPMPRDRRIALAPLRSERFSVAVAHGHLEGTGQALDDGKVRFVEVDTLAALPWILPPETSQYGRALRSGFRRMGFEPRVVHEVTDTAASLQLAAAGLGATVTTHLMSRWNVGLALDVLHLREPLSRRLVLLSRSDVAQRQSLRVFVEEATRLVDDLLASPEW